jgi:hypothetical protein
LHDYPTPLPANPIPNPTSKTGKDALKAYNAAKDATTLVRDAENAANIANQALADARHAFQQEVARGGREGQDADKERELADAIRVAEIAADPTTHRIRYASAVTSQRQAVSNWSRFVTARVSELFEHEIEPDALRVSAELIEAQERLTPFDQKYAAVKARAVDLVSLVGVGPGGLPHEWRLADYPQPPLPPRETYAPSREEPAATAES